MFFRCCSRCIKRPRLARLRHADWQLKRPVRSSGSDWAAFKTALVTRNRSRRPTRSEHLRAPVVRWTHREHRTNLSASTVVEVLGIGTWHGPLPLAWKRFWCHPGDAARHLSLPTAGSVRFGQRYDRRQSRRTLLWSLGLRPLDSLWGLRPCPLGPWFDRLPGYSIGPRAAHGAIDHGRLCSSATPS
jgi:hypothetical protein